MAGTLLARRRANYKLIPKEHLIYMPTPPEGIDSASQLQNGSEFGCLIYFRTLPRWTLFFPNQLTQLDNPAFSRLTYVFSLLSFPFSVLFFFCSFLMPRRSIRLPTCLQERLVPLLRLVFLAPPYLSSFPKPFPSTVFFSHCSHFF